MSGCREPALEAEDLADTRDVSEPHLPATDRPTVIACLFGDEAARTLSAHGLSPRVVWRWGGTRPTTDSTVHALEIGHDHTIRDATPGADDAAR